MLRVLIGWFGVALITAAIMYPLRVGKKWDAAAMILLGWSILLAAIYL